VDKKGLLCTSHSTGSGVFIGLLCTVTLFFVTHTVATILLIGFYRSLVISSVVDPDQIRWIRNYTVKKAVELLDGPSKNTLLKSNKYNSKGKIVYLVTHVFFSPLCYRMRKFDIREVQ
jgi:hypothetical protein